MHSAYRLGLAVTGLLMCCFAAPALALAEEKRVALVIGNSQYREVRALSNPSNDAGDLGAALEGLGFKVMKGVDLDKAGTDRLIGAFAEELVGAKVGLFFYAGHGLQVSGQNYLVPIDAKMKTAAALDFETVRLDLIQRTMEREASTNIIILDACRDNPLARNLARALGTRSTQIGQGLASVESGEGTLISFSTQPGNVALDGEGRNSPFTAALLKHIATPGDDLPAILINTRNDVMAATERRQVPWEHSALTARFFFSTPKASGDQEAEIALWHSVKGSSDPKVVEGYLRRYPQGVFAVVARNLVDALAYQREMESKARRGPQKAEEAPKAGDPVELGFWDVIKDSKAAADYEAYLKAYPSGQYAGIARTKLAALTAPAPAAPGQAQPSPPRAVGAAAFDGVWRFHRKSPGCRVQEREFATIIRDGRMGVRKGVGTVQSSGEFSYTGTENEGRFTWKGRLDGTKGSGTFVFEKPDRGFRCNGTVTVTRVGD